jgi:hypothetical protein
MAAEGIVDLQLYVREGALFARRFDLGALAVRGEPQFVAPTFGWTSVSA